MIKLRKAFVKDRNGNKLTIDVPLEFTRQSFTVKSEQDLIYSLQRDVILVNKERIVILGGHFPLSYTKEGAYASVKAWGGFTLYSLYLACKLTNIMPNVKEKSKLILLADDINYEAIGENKNFNRQQKSRMRNSFYKRMSGVEAEFPLEFKNVLDEYGLSLETIIRQDHGKKGRESCLFFSERILRTSKDKGRTECAKAYRALIESKYLNPSTDYFVAFIPDRCTGNVCERVLDKDSEYLFNASHISMQTDSVFLSSTDVKGIWDFGVKYRKDFLCN